MKPERSELDSRTCSTWTSITTAPIPAQREQLAALVEALLREIAAALAAGEVGDDQDHG